MGKLEHLSPLVGRWSTTITMLHPADQRGQKFHAEDIYRWLPGENILIHDVSGDVYGIPVSSIEIYSAGQNGHILARSFDSSGEVSDFGASMHDGEWRIEGESQRFASTALTQEVLEGVWQFKTESGWVDWMTVSLERTARAGSTDLQNGDSH